MLPEVKKITQSVSSGESLYCAETRLQTRKPKPGLPEMEFQGDCVVLISSVVTGFCLERCKANIFLLALPALAISVSVASRQGREDPFL